MNNSNMYQWFEGELRNVCYNALIFVLHNPIHDPDINIYLDGDWFIVRVEGLDVMDVESLADMIDSELSDDVESTNTVWSDKYGQYVIEVEPRWAVEGSTVVAMRDEYIDPPPEDPNYEQVDDYTSILEFPLDITVVVKEGYYPDVEDSESFSKQAETNLYDKETGFEYEFDNTDDILEDALRVLENYDCPEAPGQYRMTGTFKLAYDMSGLCIQHDYVNYGPEEGVSDDKEFYCNDLSVTFNIKRSSIENLNFELIAEASTSVTASDTSSVRYSNEAKKTNTKYGTYQSAEYDGYSFSIHYVEINTSPEADEDEMFNTFKAQISMHRPYDDAELISARMEKGVITYIKHNKPFYRQYYFKPSDMGIENYEWLDEICSPVIKLIRSLNQEVAPKIDHT